MKELEDQLSNMFPSKNHSSGAKQGILPSDSELQSKLNLLAQQQDEDDGMNLKYNEDFEEKNVIDE
jgi:hypothetical protein